MIIVFDNGNLFVMCIRVKDFSQVLDESISIPIYFSKKHLQKVFFAKIKIDHRKWPYVIKTRYVDVGIKRYVFPSHIKQKKNVLRK